ncbi:MAG: DNA repair and recombination protein RadA [Nitrososphaerota archaeon]|nr:DNA repair and recombination protein RadA [Candidatus Bathyarchaeota archaeon]MDW8048085.1 DNA repair and recombination protein RadA [Nitrososphaerota archaeon]
MSEDIESLDGVGVSTASKLRAAGYSTIESIAVSPPQEIMEKTGIGFNTVLKIQEAARQIVAVEFQTAKDFYERRKLMNRCTTGSKKLDEILGGGIETQAVTELIGEYGSGKTQICLMLSVTAQLPPEQGGLGGNVAFIDTEGTFVPERVYQIASARGLDPNAVASRIYVARAYNSSHQCLLIDSLFSLCPQNNIKLIVVDSMISHFRGEYLGRENLAERQQKLNQYLHKILRLSEAFNVAVVITNQVQANPSTFFGDPNRPAGGNIMAHACTHRVYLRKGSKGVRVARVIDSPYLPENSARFIITEKGIEDAEGEVSEDDF